MLPGGLAEVLAAIDPPPGLADRVARLTTAYRSHGGAAGPVFRDDHDRLAYALVRMPATALAVAHALDAAAVPVAGSLLDLGSGTGAALWAAHARLADDAVPVAVDRDPGLLALSARLLAAVDRRIDGRRGDLTDPPAGRWELVTAAYALGELPADRLPAAVDAAWERCTGHLAVVEPGTPRGAATIAAVRARLLARGAFLRAPCPHHGPCPLAAPDWCHVAVRVPRSRLHRQLKGGTLGGETEHLSYVVATRNPAPRPAARVLTAPVRGPAGIDLVLCRNDGSAGPGRIPRRDPAHAAARRLDQGDGWDPPA